ncbi:hypothetical protein [Rhizobium sp. AAP116]|uniref:hypothetical protein n=1 Tax=Rhizobium sp. AAP116 TaxID=1523429 RepID=UPI0006B8A534|nr:hypothetical protein [Rhizobium sp. AAP116]KPF57181.1 hypothetical protein IP85_14450 [Rhizobium sp. AAP116]
MARKSKASTAGIDEVRKARRPRNRLLRDTTDNITRSIQEAFENAWPIMAAMPDGRLEKTSTIVSRDQALIYKLAHRDFDMQSGLVAHALKVNGKGMSPQQVAQHVDEISDQAKQDLEGLFSGSDELPDEAQTYSPELRRVLASLKGGDPARMFDDLHTAYHNQNALFSTALDVRDSTLYQWWRNWTAKDLDPGLRAMDKLIAFLKHQQTHYPDEAEEFKKRSGADKFIGQPAWTIYADLHILAACIMAANYNAAGEEYSVKAADVRKIAELYDRIRLQKHTRKKRRK